MEVTSQALHESLQKYFGFDMFKGDQEAIVRSVLAGKDTFVIMPTGGGKSLCYQLPALMMPGTAIVISPLIALMKNQVDSVRAHNQEDEVAHFLNSSLSKAQIKQVREDIIAGKTKLLYVAPETLTKEENILFFKNVKISFVAVDEAHCISEWGHDFRPEYRRISDMIEAIGLAIPIIALTATATPKVRADIVKNLNMKEENSFVLSFNRENLYYEVRPKSKTDLLHKSIIQYIKQHSNKSGIIYVQSRKTAEDLAKLIQVNDIRSAPYHAGLDPKTRSKTQDDFLMEEIDVIVATIAFGMGIDKPDIRFVIHYDIPKSIENYYQETGRAGRDGLEGECIAFYSYKDIQRLEKFLRDKPVAEREMGLLLMNEVMAYSETSACRRRFLLHYFGEDYNCPRIGLCDNCRYPPKQNIDVTEEMELALEVVEDVQENYRIKELITFITGKKIKQILDYRHDEHPMFGVGSDRNDNFWNTIFRHALLNNYLSKDIENYGIIKLTPEGKEFLENPVQTILPLNHNFEQEAADEEELQAHARPAVLDETLLRILKDLRRRISKRKNIPPFVIFQDPSLEDMATQYPITLEEMVNVSGVSQGKAQRYGKEFVEVIARYVEDNEIERPTDFVIKSVANKSRTKVEIIQAVDRKIPLNEIAQMQGISMENLLHELELIVLSGTKVSIDYYLEEAIDEYAREEIEDYFKDAETDSVEIAYKKLKGEDINVEEIQLMRIKFLSDFGN